jgi:hypothetical protein
MTPVERALLPEVNVAGQYNYNVQKHLHETEDLQIAVNQGPRIQEDCLDIEQNKQQGHHVELDGDWFARIARGPDAAFIRLVFLAGTLVFAYQCRYDNERPRQTAREYKHQQQWSIAVEVVAVHFVCAVIIAARVHPVK